MDNNRIHLIIAGVSIVVSTSEEEAYVRRIAESVNSDMHALLTTTKASVTSAALLLAVDYMDRFQKANRSATNMRTQIKGYLSDAANAKLLFDEEKKRSDSLAQELSELRDGAEHGSRTAYGSAGTDGKSEVEGLAAERDELLNQLEQANHLLKSSETRVFGNEDAGKMHEQEEYMDRIGKQSAQISQLEQQLQQKQEEISRLQGELKTLEDMINEDLAAARQTIYNTGAAQFSPPDARAYEEQRVFGAASGNVLPPLYRPDPLLDATYDFEDLSSLNWTDGIR